MAAAAGVSVATTSAALNGREGVAPATRQRVLEVADALGYRANPQARALRRGRSDTFGLVVRNFGNPFFLDVISGAEQVASEAGGTLLVLDSNYSIGRERQHVQSMAGAMVDGLAIAPVGAGESIRLWQLLRPGAPAVALNADVDGIPGVARVMPDHRRAVELPVRRLAELGHEHISFLCAPRPLMADPARLRVFRRVTRSLGVRGHVCYTPLNGPAVEAAVDSLLASSDRPTAVVANSDYVAQAVYVAARRRRVQVGVDLSVVGHDDLPTSELLDPPLATLRVDRRAMGRELMRRLIGETPISDFVAPVDFVARASAGPAPSR